MQHYQNFKIASYVRGEFLAQTDLSEIQKGIDFFKQNKKIIILYNKSLSYCAPDIFLQM